MQIDRGLLAVANEIAVGGRHDNPEQNFHMLCEYENYLEYVCVCGGGVGRVSFC